jgi:NADH dehydrogenase
MWWYRRWKSPTGKPIRVVIVGGGFAGLYAALGLNKKLGYNHDLELTLLDRRNYFLFPPLLPSAAAGTIETRQVSFPFRRIFETTNIAFRKVSVSEIDPRAGIVRGVIEVSTDPQTGERIERETIQPYDYLVFAPGSSNQTYDVPGVERYAFFMRELNDAVVLRNHVINCFERAAVMLDEGARREMLSFVIVGGGPTGVETASELHDLIENILLKRYPEIPPNLPQVTIMQSGSQILDGWSPEIVAMTRNQLEKMGIEVRLGMRVSKVGAHSVQAGNVSLQTRTVVWTAGVKPSPLAARSGLELHSCGRIEVQEDCRARGYDNIFVLGDVAHYIDPRTRKALPPLGQVAFQQGTHTAKNLVRLLSGKGTKPFRYFNFGGLVSVGEHFAAVNLLGVTLSGFVGWFVWRTLYLFKLVGFGNKVRVVLDWTLDLVLERSISQIRDERERADR